MTRRKEFINHSEKKIELLSKEIDKIKSSNLSKEEKKRKLEKLRNKKQAQKTRKDRREKELITSRRLSELLSFTNLSKENKNELIKAFSRKHK